jgi:hypothetical protein
MTGISGNWFRSWANAAAISLMLAAPLAFAQSSISFEEIQKERLALKDQFPINLSCVSDLSAVIDGRQGWKTGPAEDPMGTLLSVDLLEKRVGTDRDLCNIQVNFQSANQRLQDWELKAVSKICVVVRPIPETKDSRPTAEICSIDHLGGLALDCKNITVNLASLEFLASRRDLRAKEAAIYKGSCSPVQAASDRASSASQR